MKLVVLCGIMYCVNAGELSPAKKTYLKDYFQMLYCILSRVD